MFRKAVRSYVLKKPDDSLSSLLHDTIQKQREEIRGAMMKFPYFTHWSEEKIHQCCVHSNIINYGENEIVRVKDDGNVYVTHFVLGGRVTVVQRLVLLKVGTEGSRKVGYQLYHDQEARTSHNPDLVSVLMQISHLTEGATFGLGEELSKHTITAEKGTKCLLIPRHLILQYFAPNNIWQRIILFLDMTIPKTEQVFHQFLQDREFKEFSNVIYSRIVTTNSRPLKTCIHDVPLTARITDIHLAKKHLKKAQSHPMYLLGDQKRASSFIQSFYEKESKRPNKKK